MLTMSIDTASNAMSDGPNFPPVIYRSIDDIAEARTPAVTAAITILHRLDQHTRNQLGAWLDRETGVYAGEEVRELHRKAL